MAAAEAGLARLHLRRPWQAELLLRKNFRRKAAWAQGCPKDTVAESGGGRALRVIHEGRQAFTSAGDPEADSVELWRRAKEIVPLSKADRNRHLFVPKGQTTPTILEQPGVSQLFRLSVEDIYEKLAAAERVLLGRDRRLKRVLDLALQETETEGALVSTEGVSARQRSTTVSVSLELMGEWRGEVQVAWESAVRRGWDSFPWQAILDQTGDRLLASFGASSLRSGRWPVIFTPRVAVEFLELWAEAACADAVQDGRSFLADRLGRRVGSGLVNFVDDGRYPGGIASQPLDDEGFPTGTTAVVEKGLLQSYLYDTYTARRDRRHGTGNAVRRGIESPPSPHITNFYLGAGTTPTEQIFAGSRRAFWVQEVMGLHTADPVSGDFSVGAAGRLVEHGRPARAVRGVTLSGNLLELFLRVDAVGNDLTWYGNAGSPTFRTLDLSVGGS